MLDQEENHRAGSRKRALFNTGIDKAQQSDTPDDSEDDQFQIVLPSHPPTIYGVFQPSLFVPPDELGEEDPTRYSVRSWTSVILANKTKPFKQKQLLYERALKHLPQSYKIWVDYLNEYCDFTLARPIASAHYASLNQLFQQSLKHLPRMPRIWLMYCQILARQHLVTKVRRTYNWALLNLPITQHSTIWASAIAWAKTLDQSMTGKDIYHRYIQLNPDAKEAYLEFLQQRDQHEAKANLLLEMAEDELLMAKINRTRLDLMAEATETMAKHAHCMRDLPVVNIMRQCLKTYPEQAGIFWVNLCEFYIRQGQFDQARATYEQAMTKITTAKHFGVVYNSYTKFEEEMISALSNKQMLAAEGLTPQDLLPEVASRLTRLQDLIKRRPFIVAELKVKTDPHSTKQWKKYYDLELDQGSLPRAQAVMNRSLAAIDPQKASKESFGRLLVHYACQPHRSLKEKVLLLCNWSELDLLDVKDHILVWVCLVETMIEGRFFNDAQKAIKHVLFRRQHQIKSSTKGLFQGLKNSSQLWALYIDIESQIGTFDTLKAAYHRCKEVKAITPIMLLGYGDLLWQNNQKENTFALYEWGIQSFTWPAANEIWLMYLSRYCENQVHSGIGLQRGRSLFEKLLKDCPQKLSPKFYFMYAQFEQKYGLLSQSISALDRLIQNSSQSDRLNHFYLYIAKVSSMLGITKTRPIFEKALAELPEKEIIQLAVFYAGLQTKLGEVERARKVYEYAAQFCNPDYDLEGVWAAWQEFELQLGGKESYRELMRVRKSVEEKFLRAGPDPQAIREKVNRGLV